MRRLLLISLILLPVLSCDRKELFPDAIRKYNGEENRTPEDDPDDVNWARTVSYVFDSSVVPDIHISVSSDEWDRLLAFYDRNPDTQEYVKCDVRYVKDREEQVITGAGLRLKGNTSRRRPYSDGRYHHVHFGLDLHKYTFDKEHTIKGLRKMDLKWFKDDPAYVREIYCYDLFRRYGVWTAINDVYAKLWLKVGDADEIYYGVYNMMEHLDRNYLRIRKGQFGTKDGYLWKCGFGAGLGNENANIGLDDDASTFQYELKTGTEETFPDAKAILVDFIHNLRTLKGDEFNVWIERHMDIPLFLRTYAVNVAVGMWDDYWNNSNNYYLYFTPGDNYKVWFIPYDYDNTLGTSVNCGVQTDSGRQDPYNWGATSRPLVTKILRNNVWKIMYKQYLQELCAEGGLFSYTSSAARIRTWQESIKYYVQNDTKEDNKMADRPATWSNHTEYRLLEDGDNNFFRVKASVVSGM
ncbi:MAG: CotH kinase family protein [Bacteroidales bacterium]|nr:CotH kinase family protein [Bacteroidales bacterium]MBP5675963.1 CotH kinase family protein [Bacteroidales bacterium]